MVTDPLFLVIEIKESQNFVIEDLTNWMYLDDHQNKMINNRYQLDGSLLFRLST